MSFTLQEADYSRLFIKDPSFPHGHFVMAADQARVTAYYKALTAAVARAAAAKQEQQHSLAGPAVAAASISQQPQQQRGAGDIRTFDSTGKASSNYAVEVTVLDVGCGSGVLSLLAAAAAEELSAAAAAGPVSASVIAADFVAPVAAAALRNVAANGCSSNISIVHGDAAMLQQGVHVPLAGVDVIVLDVFDSGALAWSAAHAVLTGV